jgi:hypothetical protein
VLALFSDRLEPKRKDLRAVGEEEHGKIGWSMRRGKPPLRRQHHYRKIVSYHRIPPAKPAPPGSR